MSYYPEIIKFLAQSKTDKLGTSDYLIEYQNLEVKVSFGKGNPARIPWIAFLNEVDTVQEGIYPVYLYFKENQLLILAYGVSETRKSKRIWDIEGAKTIADYFKEQNIGTPDRYGNSLIFHVYDTKKEISKEEIDEDLNKLLSYYKTMKVEKSMKAEEFKVQAFLDDCKNVGLFTTNNTSLRIIASLLTKPFVILTGLSGSGKTKLAQAFVQWICSDTNQYQIIPVGADWTNREPLLGFPNALKPDEYVKPDSGVLDLIIQANKQPNLPFFIILDEMNLSHVERYFADFLSAMESKEAIPLYSGNITQNGVPPRINLPPNLFFIGTVNIDETTNMFSPKVLDRANTIEFRISENEMAEFLGTIKNINLDELSGKGTSLAKNFLDISQGRFAPKSDMEIINQILVKFFKELKKTGAEFGFRSASEIHRLIRILGILDNQITLEQKIDISIMQKLLPKLHGSRRKLCPILETLGKFCIKENNIDIKDVFENDEFDYNISGVQYPLSLEKISRMYRSAIDNGFASFAEA